MKTGIRLRTMRNGQAAMLLFASALAIGLSSLPAKSDPARSDTGGGFSYGIGRGPPSIQPEKKGSVGYGSDANKGFGDYHGVTLPPDRVPPAGTSTGIPIRSATHPAVPPPQYRPQ